MHSDDQFEIRVASPPDGDGVSLVLSGELDAVTVPQLAAALSDALAGPGVRQITVDLSELDFVDSSGIRAFLLGRLEAERAQVAWSMTGARDSTLRVLRIAGVEQFLGCGVVPTGASSAGTAQAAR